MTGYDRYAIYYAPPPGPLADWAAGWLGWDPATGRAAVHPVVAGLPRPVAALTATPRKYGFHGTLKPPFRLAHGTSAAGLAEATAALAARLKPVTLPGLHLARLGGFVALIPEGGAETLGALATEVVARLDGFRAPPEPAELARRRPERLTQRQRALLDLWGYPHVMEEFRFHLTLTGDLAEDEAEAARAALAPVLAPLVPRPFAVTELCLFGEAAGMFHLLHRYPLAG